MLDQFVTPDITFLGEQDGPAERRLKEALGVLLRLDPAVIRAYLARVLYDGKTGGVALGLLTDDERDNEKPVEQMGRAFAALFNTSAHLDVVFLNEDKDAEIRKTCPPFYNRYAVWQALPG